MSAESRGRKHAIRRGVVRESYLELGVFVGSWFSLSSFLVARGRSTGEPVGCETAVDMAGKPESSKAGKEESQKAGKQETRRQESWEATGGLIMYQNSHLV